MTYKQALQKLGKRNVVSLGRFTRLIRHPDSAVLRYYDTNIIIWYPQKVILSLGETGNIYVKRTINKYAPGYVFDWDDVTYVRYNGKIYFFRNGAELYPNGTNLEQKNGRMLTPAQKGYCPPKNFHGYLVEDDYLKKAN